MELLQLKYFSELAKRQHLNKTAQDMLVTPSAISSSLARLEQELGVRLFDRIGRNIRLNVYGMIFQKYVEQALSSLNSGMAELQAAQNLDDGSVSVAVTNPVLWNKPLTAFSAEHSEISISLLAFDTGADVDSTAHMNPMVENADFYIATTEETINAKYEFKSQLLFNAKMFLAVPSNHRFAKRAWIDLAEARDEWFVNSPHKTSFRVFCDNLCRQAGFIPKSRIECDYILRPKMLLNENMVCLVTALGRHSGLCDGIVMIPIASPYCIRPQAIYWRANAHLSKSAQTFRDFMVSYCSKL